MTRSILCWVSIVALVTVVPAHAHEHAAKDKRVLHDASSQSKPAKDDCETSISKLDASQAEGEERLAEKNAVIGRCASQYKNDMTIGMLVKECAKYEEQPVVKRQFVAECQLAAFSYANALRTLKAEYRK